MCYKAARQEEGSAETEEGLPSPASEAPRRGKRQPDGSFKLPANVRRNIQANTVLPECLASTLSPRESRLRAKAPVRESDGVVEKGGGKIKGRAAA